MSKKLIDGTKVPDSLYYYALDYRDRMFNTDKISWFVTSISKLNKVHFIEFVKRAIADDLKHI